MLREYRGRVFLGLPGLLRERNKRGWTQKRLSEVSGVSPHTIIRVERGENDTTPDTAAKLALALGVELDALTREEPVEEQVSLLEVGEPGAGLIEEKYTDHFAGGEAVDPEYEEEIAEKYLRIVRQEGSTDESIKRALNRALLLGKTRGDRLA